MDILNEFPLVDEHGKRYREFGRGCREYAPSLVTSVGEVPMGRKRPESPVRDSGLPLETALFFFMLRHIGHQTVNELGVLRLGIEWIRNQLL